MTVPGTVVDAAVLEGEALDDVVDDAVLVGVIVDELVLGAVDDEVATLVEVVTGMVAVVVLDVLVEGVVVVVATVGILQWLSKTARPAAVQFLPA